MAKTSGGVRGKSNTSSSISRKREGYVKTMQSLIKKNVVRYVGNDKHIKIKFNKNGIAHIADDMLTKKLGISKNELHKLDSYLRDATYIKSSGLYKERKDGITKFYYFDDKNKNIRYNVAEREYRDKRGIRHNNRFLYSITKI